MACTACMLPLPHCQQAASCNIVQHSHPSVLQHTTAQAHGAAAALLQPDSWCMILGSRFCASRGSLSLTRMSIPLQPTIGAWDCSRLGIDHWRLLLKPSLRAHVHTIACTHARTHEYTYGGMPARTHAGTHNSRRIFWSTCAPCCSTSLALRARQPTRRTPGACYEGLIVF